MAFVDIIAAGVAAAAEGLGASAATAAAVESGTAAGLAGIGNAAGAAVGALPEAMGGAIYGIGNLAGSVPGLTGLSQGLNGLAGAGAEGAQASMAADVLNVGKAGEAFKGAGLAGEAGSAGAPALPASTSATGGGFTGFGKLGDTLATNAILNTGQQGLGAIQQDQANAQSRKVGNQIAAQQGWGGFSQGGYAALHAAHGGSVHVRDGAFVIPADVVSALGNGSSKAGARFLTHLFASLERGPAPEAGNLAADRAMKRHAKRSAA